MYPYLALSVSPYPNSALSAGQLAIIAIVPVLTLAAWLILMFAADRRPPAAAPRRGGNDVAAAAAACTGTRA